MILQAALKALAQIFSPALRKRLWQCLALTVGLLVVTWIGLTKLFGVMIDKTHTLVDYPVVENLIIFLAGAGIFITLAYLLPPISALVAGFFLDDVAEEVERRDFPQDPPGKALSIGRSLIYGLRFAGLSLLVNAVALMLFFIPVVNVAAFFLANSYLLGREYFELAAGRAHPMAKAAQMRADNRGTVLLAGMVLAGLLLVPIFNLVMPLFGVAFMVHLHKRLENR